MADDFACEILDPEDPSGPRVKAIFPGHYTSYLYKFRLVSYENLRAAKHVLEHPLRIFRGVREFQDGGWCFVGRPDTWYLREDTKTTFPDNLVFAVYLNPRLRVYEHRSEKADPDDRESPIQWQERYGGVVWTPTF